MLMRAQVQLEPAPPPVLPDFITQHLDPFSGDDDTADIDAATGAVLSNLPPLATSRSRRCRSATRTATSSKRRSAATRRARADRARSTSIATGSSRSGGAAAPAPIDRTELRRAYRPDEEQVVAERIAQARLSADELGEATATARALVKGVRAHKPSGVDAFLHAYDLGSDEGIAMMCLAEALLRIPDAHTADELIADKLAGPGLVGEARPLGLGVRQRRDLLAAADRQGARRRAGPLRQLEGGAWPRGRAARRAGRPHRGARGDEDPRPQFRLRPDDRRGAEARRARAAARASATASTCSARRPRPSRTPSATPKPIATRSTASPRRRRAASASRRAFRSS